MQTLVAVDAQHKFNRRYERLARLVSRTRAAFWIAIGVFVISLPAMTMGMIGDDFDLGLAVGNDPLSAYAFQPRDPVERRAQLLAERDAGSVPWWTDLEFHQAFLRPLSSLSLALDFALWRSAPWLMHVENSLWFALIVLLAASIYDACGLPQRSRGLATLFFAVQGGQSMTIGWISARNTLLVTLFGFLSLRLFMAAHSSKRWPWQLFAWLAFAAALASGEGGVAALAYMFAYALCFGNNSAPTQRTLQRTASQTAPLARVVAMLWAFGVLLVAWGVVYVRGGYGAHNAGFYVDPIDSPGQFLRDLACTIPIYLATQLTLPLASLSVAVPLAMPITTAVSIAILVVSRGLWLPWLREDARGRFFGIGAVLAILPLGACPAQDRLVSFIALGMCGLLALIVEERLGSVASELPQGGARRLLRYHVIWAPILFFPNLFASASMVAGGGGNLLDEQLGSGTGHVILVNAPSPLPPHFVASKRRWYGQAAPPINLLYAGGSDLILERTGEQSLTLTATRGYFVGRLERFGRDPEHSPMQAGDVINGQRMRVQVLEVEAGAPKRVRFDFVQPLGASRVFTWQGRSIAPLPLPELGNRVQVQAASAL